MRKNNYIGKTCILSLPFFALAGMLWNHSKVKAANNAAAIALARDAHSPQALAHVTDVKLFFRANGKLKVANASAYQFQTGTDPGSGFTALNVSTFSTDAALLYDNSPGDLSTGYTVIKTTGSHPSQLWLLIDLGTSQPVSKWEIAGIPASGSTIGIELFRSNNGTGWASTDLGILSSSGSLTRTITTTSARWWQLVFENPSTTLSMTTTDSRLYDGSGTIYGPPGGGGITLVQMAAFRNSQTF